MIKRTSTTILSKNANTKFMEFVIRDNGTVVMRSSNLNVTILLEDMGENMFKAFEDGWVFSEKRIHDLDAQEKWNSFISGEETKEREPDSEDGLLFMSDLHKHFN